MNIPPNTRVFLYPAMIKPLPVGSKWTFLNVILIVEILLEIFEFQNVMNVLNSFHGDTQVWGNQESLYGGLHGCADGGIRALVSKKNLLVDLVGQMHLKMNFKNRIF